MATLFQEIQIPNQKHLPNSPPFPAVLGPNPTWSPSPSPPPCLADLTRAIETQRPYLETLLHKTGAILFRGFPISTASEFNQVVEAFGFPDYPYVGGSASRTRVVGRVFTANESPPDQKIPFHHEMAFVPEFPTKLMFFCEEEPGSGGETPVVLSHVVYERMRGKFPDFVEKLEKEGLLSTRVLAEEDDHSSAIGRGWKSTFSTHDKHLAQQKAEKLGMRLEWMEGCLARTTIGPIPAFKQDESRGNRKVWFNGMVASYTAFGDQRNDPTNSVKFGNGDPLPSEAVYGCLGIMEEESVAIPWRKGDLLLIDNGAVLHSRRLFTPPRRILAAICK